MGAAGAICNWELWVRVLRARAPASYLAVAGVCPAALCTEAASVHCDALTAMRRAAWPRTSSPDSPSPGNRPIRSHQKQPGPAGTLGLLPKVGGLERLTRGGSSKERAAAHGHFLLAILLKEVLEEKTALAAIARWCAAARVSIDGP